MKEPDCYVFRGLGIKNGYITVSRHLKPDFVAGLTEEQIKENWEIYPVYFKKEESISQLFHKLHTSWDKLKKKIYNL